MLSGRRAPSEPAPGRTVGSGARRPGAAWLIGLVAVVAGCAGATQSSSTSAGSAEPSASATIAATATASPSSEPSEAAVDSPCLEADILAALEAYKDVEIPSEPTMAEVADAFEALELDGRAAEYRDSLIEALRDDTETVDSMRLQSIIFALLPLESEVELVEC